MKREKEKYMSGNLGNVLAPFRHSINIVPVLALISGMIQES